MENLDRIKGDILEREMKLALHSIPEEYRVIRRLGEDGDVILPCSLRASVEKLVSAARDAQIFKDALRFTDPRIYRALQTLTACMMQVRAAMQIPIETVPE